jgi:RsiW-degrading membrane proteinase PrsW (M82 family)
MAVAILLHAAIGLLPVAGLLAALVVLDGYKLVAMRLVLLVAAAGVAVAVAAYFANGALIAATGLGFSAYSRYVGPVVEETGKALVIVALLRMHRIGFLVDAAILGFAVGAGFAIVENVWYQVLVPDAGIATWIVRGFGTALMHGGTTAIFAMMAVTMLERAPDARLAGLVPGFAIAVLLHAGFNHLLAWPRVSTLVVLGVLPPLIWLVFERSERAVADWLGHGFDADAGLIESIGSGRFPDSHAGRYLAELRARFKGEVVADLLCYLRVHTELALRAKGILMMRENGFEAAVDDDMRAQLGELDYLARSIGRTGLLALHPLIAGDHRARWQLNMLAGEAAAGPGTAGPPRAA